MLYRSCCLVGPAVLIVVMKAPELDKVGAIIEEPNILPLALPMKVQGLEEVTVATDDFVRYVVHRKVSP